MLSDEEVLEQIPNLDIQKSFKKEFIIFLIENIILIGLFAPVVYSITVLTSESVWIKQIVKYKCTDTYLQNILLNF